MAVYRFTSLSEAQQAYCDHRNVFEHPHRFRVDKLMAMFHDLDAMLAKDCFVDQWNPFSNRSTYLSVGERTYWSFRCETEEDLTLAAMIFQKHSKLDCEGR